VNFQSFLMIDLY